MHNESIFFVTSCIEFDPQNENVENTEIIPFTPLRYVRISLHPFLRTSNFSKASRGDL